LGLKLKTLSIPKANKKDMYIRFGTKYLVLPCHDVIKKKYE
jgi:hypothetical protein